VKEDVRMIEAEPEDVSGLDIVRRQAIETGFTDVYERSQFADLVARPDPNLRDWIEDENHLVLKVESDMTPFAYGVVDRSSGEIKGLYTAETYQDEGHAKRLLKRMETEAESSGLEVVSVDAPKNSKQFFERVGYRDEGTADREELSIELRLMKKSLRES
jgi:N-acetylglutamate synthase-like GNAT family acetyltransferase